MRLGVSACLWCTPRVSHRKNATLQHKVEVLMFGMTKTTGTEFQELARQVLNIHGLL